MLCFSDIREYATGEMGGAVEKTKTPLKCLHPSRSLALALQTLTSPSALALVSQDKDKHQDWTLPPPTAAEWGWLVKSPWADALLFIAHTASTKQGCSHTAAGRSPRKERDVCV